MADVNSLKNAQRPTPAAPMAEPGTEAEEPLYWMMELLFFAYRDFVSDADAVLAQFGFGRAHHRVLHFVNRNPGIRVADLLDTLRITKQSLGRVLKQLVDTGYIEQRTGRHDRRQRLLYTTEKGKALASELALPQSRRIHSALAGLPPGGREAARAFLIGMINESDREGIERMSGLS